VHQQLLHILKMCKSSWCAYLECTKVADAQTSNVQKLLISTHPDIFLETLAHTKTARKQLLGILSMRSSSFGVCWEWAEIAAAHTEYAGKPTLNFEQIIQYKSALTQFFKLNSDKSCWECFLEIFLGGGNSGQSLWRKNLIYL